MQRQQAVKFAKQSSRCLSMAQCLDNIPNAIAIIHDIDSLLAPFPICPAGYGMACSVVACSIDIRNINYGHSAGLAANRLWHEACQIERALPTLAFLMPTISAAIVCTRSTMRDPILFFDTLWASVLELLDRKLGWKTAPRGSRAAIVFQYVLKNTPRVA